MNKECVVLHRAVHLGPEKESWVSIVEGHGLRISSFLFKLVDSLEFLKLGSLGRTRGWG